MNDYIDKLAPKHCKTSCRDDNAANARYSEDDFGGCYRCTLIAAASHVQRPEGDDDDPSPATLTREKQLEELLLEAHGEGELSKGLNIRVSKALGLS